MKHRSPNRLQCGVAALLCLACSIPVAGQTPPIISPAKLLTTGRITGLSAAYDASTDTYLVVWSENLSPKFLAQRLDRSGTAIGPRIQLGGIGTGGLSVVQTASQPLPDVV